MNHIAWDKGVVTEEAAAMLAIEFGVYATHKTCKTQCGKRVAVAKIDNAGADCPDCRRIVVESAQRNRFGLLDVLASPHTTEADRPQVERAIAFCEAEIARFG